MPINRYVIANNKPKLRIGDLGFAGFRSRQQNNDLPEGIARYAENMRFENGVAKVRAGTEALSTDVVLSSAPIVIGFTLAADFAVTSITRAVNTATVTTTLSHGYTTGDRVNIRGATQSDYNGDYTITVTGAATFTYTVANSPATPATGTIIANKGPLVYDIYSDRVRGSCTYADAGNVEGICLASTSSAWAYVPGDGSTEIAYPANQTVAEGDTCDLIQFMGYVYLFRGRKLADSIAVTSITQAAGTATLTAAANHNLATGDYVDIRGATQNGYNGIVQVTVTGATTFTYTVDGGTASPATGTITIMEVKPTLRWDMNVANDFTVVTGGPNAAGGTHRNMPAADWGDHFTSCMVLPYDRDELLISDPFDPATYDTAYSQLRIDPDTKDWLVGVHPFQELQLLVFYRKSIHLLVLNTSLVPTHVSVISRDIGCVSRKTIKTCGGRILWLSDMGVHSLSIGDTVSLRNDSKPLSDPIQDKIDEINFEQAGNAVAEYYNNRYYLSAPTGDDETNSTTLIYNFTNGEWESVDSYPGSFDIQGWHKIDYQGRQRLHASTTYGFVYLMEENENDEFGSVDQVEDIDITARLYTRKYRPAGLDRGRFNRLQITGDMDTGDVLTADFKSYDPDATATNAINYTATSDTDVSLRASIHGRGQAGSVEITTTAGRPEIRTVVVEGTSSDRQIVNTK
jgi:hypothetical protein